MQHNSFGAWVKQRRKHLHVTQQTLATRAGCAVTTLRKVEANRLRLSRQLAARLALALALPDTLHDIFQHAARTPDAAVPAALQTATLAPSTPPTPTAQLPLPPTPLIGREHDLAALRTLILQPDVRLISILGLPGVGKTHLGLQIAVELAPAFTDGARFVALAEINQPELVLPAIAQALDLYVNPAQPLLDPLLAMLRDKHLLLLIDSAEHVTQAAATFATLLAYAPHVKILVTSRRALHLAGEQRWIVGPLALPVHETLDKINTIATSPAVDLFCTRARAVRPDFALAATNVAAVVELCRRLDGLPLVIELAAARLDLFSPQALLRRLDHRLDLLTTGTIDASSRHQTLRRALAWSYNLLDADQQRLFRRLGVFVGSWTLEAAYDVCEAQAGISRTTTGQPTERAAPAVEFFQRVVALVDHHLLQTSSDTDGEPRFSMIESLRSFALEQLRTQGEISEARQRHAVYYVRFIEHAAADLPQDAARWVHQVEHEYADLRAAFAWCHSTGHENLSLRLVNALYMFWDLRGAISEGRSWLDMALARSARSDALLRAAALAYASQLAAAQGDHLYAVKLAEASLAANRSAPNQLSTALALSTLGSVASIQAAYAQARAHYEASVRVARTVGEPTYIALLLVRLAYVLKEQGDSVQARSLLDEAVRLSRAEGTQLSTARALAYLGHFAGQQGEYDQAAALLCESLRLAQMLGDKPGIARALNHLGELARSQEHDVQAALYYQQSVAIWQTLGLQLEIAIVLHNLGHVMLRQDDIRGAARAFSESLTLWHRLGDPIGVALCLLGFAATAYAYGHWQAAAQWYGWGSAQFEAVGAVADRIDQLAHTRLLANLQAQLHPAIFDQARTTGQALPLATAVAEAVALATLIEAQTEVQAQYPNGLTVREVEVLRLVAHGLTNGQIAARLIISPRTVNTHLTGIYGKLRVSSRSAATRFAIEHDLA